MSRDFRKEFDNHWEHPAYKRVGSWSKRGNVYCEISDEWVEDLIKTYEKRGDEIEKINENLSQLTYANLFLAEQTVTLKELVNEKQTEIDRLNDTLLTQKTIYDDLNERFNRSTETCVASQNLAERAINERDEAEVAVGRYEDKVNELEKEIDRLKKENRSCKEE